MLNVDFRSIEGIIVYKKISHNNTLYIRSWIIFSLLLGVCYSSGYTSLFSQPRFDKLINTVDDFVRRGITVVSTNRRNTILFLNISKLLEVHWGYFNAANDYVATLPQSKVKKYRDILNYSTLETLPERIHRARTIKNYALPVRALNNYVTDITYMMDDALKRRLMKECVQINYSVFVLQKFSPFTDFFSEKMKRFIT